MSATDPRRPSRFVFIVGSGRCGSTLVQEVLSRHPDVGFISNIDDRIGRWVGSRFNNQLYRHVPPDRTRKGRLRYAPSEAYRMIAREVSPLVAEPGRPLVSADVTPWLADRFQRAFTSRADAQRRPVFAHKFTGWPRVSFVDAILPDVRFINVVRDGRAVASSLVQMPWWRDHEHPATFGLLPAADVAAWEEAGRSFVLLAGFVWKAVVDAHEAARADVDAGRWLDIRYEDVLADPRSAFARILSFAGLEWNDPFERQFAHQSFEGGRRDAFARDLSAPQLSLLEHHLAGHLERYGYSPSALAQGDRRGDQ